MYHNQFRSYFGLWIYFTVKVIVLFNPFDWTNRNSYSLISLWIVIISDYNFIDLINYLSGFFFIDFHIWFIINSFHCDHEEFSKLSFNYLANVFEHSLHTEGVFMVWSDKWRYKENSIIEWVLNYWTEMLQHFEILLILSTCQKKDISLHSMDKYSGDYFNIRVSLLCPFEIVFTIVFTHIQLN